MYLPRSSERRRAWLDRARGEDAAPTRTPTRMRLLSSDMATTIETPRDCVLSYPVGIGRVHIISYKKDGTEYEEHRMFTNEDVDFVERRMLERMREADSRASRVRRWLKIVPRVWD